MRINCMILQYSTTNSLDIDNHTVDTHGAGIDG